MDKREMEEEECVEITEFEQNYDKKQVSIT
jgi:hypothetical protein